MNEFTSIPDALRNNYKRLVIAAPHADIALFMGQGVYNAYLDHAQHANAVSKELAPLKSFSDPEAPLAEPVYVAAIKSEQVRKFIDAATARYSVALVDVAANGSFVTVCHLPRRKGEIVEAAIVQPVKAVEPEEDFL